VVGAGYVGLVTGAGLAEQGHEVWCVDVDRDKIDRLERGDVPISESGLAERIFSNRDRMHYALDQSAAAAASSARIVISAVGTPPRADGSADLKQVRCLVDDLPADRDVVLVMKSTVPPGTGTRVRDWLRHAGKKAAYVSCPEFLQEGVALDGFDHPDRVVIGCSVEDAWAGDLVRDLHSFVDDDDRILCTDVTSAETIKYCANLHLSLRISYANQVANLCEAVGADASEVLEGVGRDQRIGDQFLRPGVGFGGSCFEKDARGLAAVGDEVGVPMTLAREVVAINRAQPLRVVSKLVSHLGPLEGRRVAILGLTFKPGTDDIRSSPAFRIIERLRDERAIVRAWDPDERARAKARRHTDEGKSEWLFEHELAGSLSDALHGADAAVVTTDWPQIVGIDWTAQPGLPAGALVVDGRNCLEPTHVRAGGFRYEGMGRHNARDVAG
jgi:UDPglucose 6-dehydrogenase